MAGESRDESGSQNTEDGASKFLARRGKAGEHLVITLTFIVGFLSLITGVVNLASTTRLEIIARYVPEIVRTGVALTGAFTGFAMLVSAYGLKRRLRVAWYSAAFLFPITALQGVAQSSILSLPLILLSVAALPTLVVNRKRFDREASLSTTQRGAFVTLAGVLSYGTVGTYALRNDFEKVSTPLDAFYYTVVTSSTVGYGDAYPKTQLAETFSISLIIVGVAGFTLALATLLTPAIEARLTAALGKMTESQLDLLEDHIVVLGYGELTEPIVSELEGKVEFVIITDNSEKASRLSERGYQVITADPSDEESLERVKIQDALAAVVATSNDAEDSLAILTARHLNPNIRIVAAAADQENIPKLKRAGADTVISPASIAGHLLVESALSGADTEEIADKILEDKIKKNGETAGENK